MSTTVDNSTTAPVAAFVGERYTPGVERTPIKSLDQQDFLKLLVTQMANQDPLSPNGDMEFMGQMASFTALEQTRAMVSDLSEMRMDQEMLQANAMIGRTVEIDAGDGISWYGTVTSVQVVEGTPKVVVGGELYDLNQLKTISMPGAPA